MKKSFFIISLVTLLLSCSSDINLSNSEALRILEESFSEDCFSEMTQRTLTNWKTHQQTYTMMKELERLKLITLSQKQVGYGFNNFATEYRWKPTARSEQDFRKSGHLPYNISNGNRHYWNSY